MWLDLLKSSHRTLYDTRWKDSCILTINSKFISLKNLWMLCICYCPPVNLHTIFLIQNWSLKSFFPVAKSSFEILFDGPTINSFEHILIKAAWNVFPINYFEGCSQSSALYKEKQNERKYHYLRGLHLILVLKRWKRSYGDRKYNI